MLRQFAHPAAAIAMSALAAAVWWPAWWGFVLFSSGLALSVWWGCVVQLRIPEEGRNYLAVWRGSLFRLVRCSLFRHHWGFPERSYGLDGFSNRYDTLYETIFCRRCRSAVTSWTRSRYGEQE